MLRAVLLLVGLTLGALATPWPWAGLWLAVPAVVCAALLLAWRYGAVAWSLAGVLAVAAALAVVFPSSGLRVWHVMWLPLAAATGAWMGLREEGGGPTLGERAWMHVPLLLGAFVLPVLPGLHDALVRVEARARVQEQQLLATMAKEPAAPGSWRHVMEESARVAPAVRVRMLKWFLPNVAFLALFMLVGAGRTLAARAAVVRGWPPLSHPLLTGFRLPDGALVPLLAGLALALFTNATWHPGAAFLLVQAVLGYSVQGTAVVIAVLAARGVPPTFVMLAILFLFAFTLPVFLPSLALIGLSDVWLDHRRLEPSPRGEA